MYSKSKLNIADNMKSNIILVSEIKIKLVSNDFFNMDNLLQIGSFLDPKHLSIASVDIGIDRVIKFSSYISIYEILRNHEIPIILRNWINSSNSRFNLSSILTEEELDFFTLHFEMFYQIETFPSTNTIFVRI